ncbi:hypothetical protein, partial [Roseibacillus persicicus]|uniref:hypothetical protein n=1 Tax=Roseibacillus persicicus TaxID=454148 RepID=UPI0035E5C281
MKFGFTATWLHIKDAMIFQVTESGAETLSLMESVFVDAEVLGTFQVDSFGCFPAGKLLIDTLDGCFSDSLPLSNGAGANSLVVKFVNGLPEEFGTLPAGPDAREFREKGARAS